MVDGRLGENGLPVQRRVIPGLKIVLEVVPSRNQDTVGKCAMESGHLWGNVRKSLAEVNAKFGFCFDKLTDQFIANLTNHS